MFSRDHTLRRSWAILHSSWFFILAATALETVIFVSYFPLSWRQTFLGPVLFWELLIARIFYYSGVYGVLIEIASQEELFFSLAKFAANVRRNIKIYLAVMALPLVVHFLLFALGLQKGMSSQVVFFCGDIFFSALMAGLLISSKYLKPLKLSWRKIPVSWQEALVLLAILGTEIFLAQLVVPDMGRFRQDWILIGVFKYLHLLGFLILAQVILETYPEVREKGRHPKEVYLINPVTSGVFTSWAFTLLKDYAAWSAILKALTPPEYFVREFSRPVWAKRYVAPGKLVALSCYSSNSPEAYKIAKEFRKKGSTVIMGGPHVMNLPDEALEFCDSVVIGEAEGVWPQIISDYERGCLQKKYYAQEDAAAFRKVYESLRETPPETLRYCLETVRGCKFKCSFCAVPGLGVNCLRQKPLEEVVELVRRVKTKFSNFVFLDNNIYAVPAFSRQLFDALIPFKVKWYSSSSIDIAQNDEVLNLAKASGCRMLLIGYEITPESEQQQQDGKFALVKKYQELTRKIKKTGIAVKAQFIIGFDTDTWRSWLRVWKFCFQITPRYGGLSILTPFPGSAIFGEMLAQDRITTLNWRNYNCWELVFQPRNLPAVLLREPVFAILTCLNLYTTSSGMRLAWVLLFLMFYFGMK